MSYQYDAFFSYKRDPESDAWHLNVKEKLEFHLKLELEKENVNIFFDTEDISAGKRWRHRLANALSTSKCLICIWSPLYFRSKWCASEWSTFQAREADHDIDLVIPARYHDGNSFPKAAKDIQSRDFSDYASTMSKFWDTELAVAFENSCLKPFATEIANAIREAPPFDENFPIIEASDRNMIGRPTIPRVTET